jgi:SPOR domain
MAWLWLRLALLALPLAALPASNHAYAQAAAAAASAEPDEAEQEPQAESATAKTRKPRAPADASKTLDAAKKSLDDGKAEQAIQQVNSLLAGAKIDVKLMARAMVLRGAAWRKQGKPAQAISDLTSALWLKGGLSEADRAAALAMRTEAYREAGLADPAPSDARASGGRQNEASARVASTGQTDSVAPAEKSASPPATAQKSGGGFFSNLFGGGSSGTASAPTGAGSSTDQAERERRKAPSAAAAQPAIGTSWSTVTDVKPSPPKSRVETAAARDGPVTTASARAGSGYRVQVASVRSRSEAQALASKVKAQHAAVLGARQLDIDETVIGNMGTFYRVRIGPFANAEEPGSLCATLRGSGLDCLILAD